MLKHTGKAKELLAIFRQIFEILLGNITKFLTYFGIIF